jgi:hypothetical protein
MNAPDFLPDFVDFIFSEGYTYCDTHKFIKDDVIYSVEQLFQQHETQRTKQQKISSRRVNE